MEAEAPPSSARPGSGHLTRDACRGAVRGQGHELKVEVPSGPLGPDSMPLIRRAHAEVYAAHYGYAEPDAPLEATNWEVEMACVAPPLRLGGREGETAADPRKGSRPVYLPEGGGFVDCPVYDRYRLGAARPYSKPGDRGARDDDSLLPATSPPWTGSAT